MIFELVSAFISKFVSHFITDTFGFVVSVTNSELYAYVPSPFLSLLFSYKTVTPVIKNCPSFSCQERISNIIFSLYNFLASKTESPKLVLIYLLFETAFL